MSIKASVMFRLTDQNTALGAALQKVLDREVDSYANRYKTALTRAMKQIMEDSVRNWHYISGIGGTTAEILASSIEASSAFIRTTKNKKVIQVRARIGGGAIEEIGERFPDAAKWASKFSEYCTMSVGEYIFDLRWNQGILALPLRSWARGLDWENPHFLESGLGPMKTFCMSEVMVNLPRIASGLIRGRNQRMGAGMQSVNRGGIANLGHSEGGET